MRNGFLISAVLHGGILAFLLAGPVSIVDPLQEPPELSLDMVFETPEAPTPVIAEPADPVVPEESVASAEPPPAVDEFLEPPEISDESKTPEAVPEPDVVESPVEPTPDQPSEADPSGETLAEPPAPEPDPLEEPQAVAETPAPEERAKPETAVSAPLDTESTEAEPVNPEPVEPETTEPETAEPKPLEPTAVAEVPRAGPPAPTPRRKPTPTIARIEPEQDAPEAPPQEDLQQAEASPVPELVTEPEPEPEQSYRTPTAPGAFTPSQLLGNLVALRDEEAQAKANPELWSVIRAVRAQVARCWLLSPAEARNPKLSVDIAVAFDQSGKLVKAQVQEVGRMVTDEAYKDFAMAAHSALKTCSPFDLPAAQYDLWQRFTMRFVPRSPS